MKLNIQLKFFYLAFFLTYLFFLIYGSFYLRPAADDYCYGQNASHGFIGGVLHWWQTWSGFLLTNFFGNLTIGLPLVYLNWDFTSGFTFLFTTLFSSLSVLLLINKHIQGLHYKFIIILLIIFSWIYYITSPKFLAFKSHEAFDLATGLLHWQTLNGTYVLQFIFIFVCINLINKFISPVFYSNLFYFILFILAGTSGSSIALAILILLFLLTIFINFSNYFRLNFNIITLILSFFGCIIGILISHLSPGNLIRQELLSPDFNMGFFNIFIVILKSSYFTVKYLAIQLVNFSTISTFILTILGFYILIPINNLSAINNFFRISIFFIIISTITAFTSYLSGYFAYNAYWHRTTSHLSFFYFLIFISLWLASKLKYKLIYKLNFNNDLLIHIAFSTMLFFGLFIQIITFIDVRDRHERWNNGPAPIGKVSDIEGDWQRACWNNLNSIRKKIIHR